MSCKATLGEAAGSAGWAVSCGELLVCRSVCPHTEGCVRFVPLKVSGAPGEADNRHGGLADGPCTGCLIRALRLPLLQVTPFFSCCF